MFNLKSCPFCGSTATLTTDPEAVLDSQGRYWAYTVVCDNCCATSGTAYTPEMATELWNRRVDNG